MLCPGAMRQKLYKPIIKEAFVAFSEEIITNYNDLYVFLCVEPWIYYHFHMICDRRNAKQALLYTAQNSRLNSQWQFFKY